MNIIKSIILAGGSGTRLWPLSREQYPKQFLKFGEICKSPNIRMLSDMKDVVFDKEWIESADNFELYYMYRSLHRQNQDHETIKESNLRYDITIIPPNMLAREYAKTAGHYHPKIPGTDISYPEAYQVLEGEAMYLLQKMEDERVIDVIAIEAKAEDIVLIPPNYGHVTINKSDQTLKMANWVCDSFASIYEPIKRFTGAAYYLLKDGFVKNPNYTDVPAIRNLSPVDVPEFGLFNGKDMYKLVNDIERLRFLTEPQDFAHVFERIYKNKNTIY